MAANNRLWGAERIRRASLPKGRRLCTAYPSKRTTTIEAMFKPDPIV